MTEQNNTYVFADVHGGYQALKQIFERAPIKYSDTIISLGDIADGWPETFECVDLLLQMQEHYNMIFIRGNHDEWAQYLLNTGRVSPEHADNGGNTTAMSYTNRTPDDIDRHRKFFRYQHDFYIDEQNRCFVHGGFNRHTPIKQDRESHQYTWNRLLWKQALSCKNVKLKTADDFNEIFIGHTTTVEWKKITPMYSGGVWNLDTGGGYAGKLTIMDVNTKEYWQSDLLETLYPDYGGKQFQHKKRKK